MKKLIIGFDHLDLNSINQNYVLKSNDKYLNKLDFNLLAKSFSFHYDCINFSKKHKNKLLEHDELILIAESIEKYPYIISNTNSNIYGFQSHPEICLESIECAINSLKHSTENEFELKNILGTIELEKIYKHFYNIFLN